MSRPMTVGDALRANLEAANKALDTYLESVIEAPVYHALHGASVAAKAALDAYGESQPDSEEPPPVVGERYRDVVARIYRTAAHQAATSQGNN